MTKSKRLGTLGTVVDRDHVLFEGVMNAIKARG